MVHNANRAAADMPQPSANIDDYRAKAGLFRFLGRALEEEVDADFLRLIRGELRSVLGETGLQFDEHFFQEDEQTLLAALAEEYTTLFIAPGGVSLYASAFETGCLFQEQADRALAAYRQAGWDYQHKMSGEFPDHIGTMLAFVGLLYDSEADALDSGAGNRAQSLCRQRMAFLLDQLGPWAIAWCHKAATASFHPFYQQLIRLMEDALWTELNEVADRKKLRELMALNQREPKKLDYDADFRKASGV